MKKQKRFAVAALAFAAVLGACSPSKTVQTQENASENDGKLDVMASFYPMYDFAVKVAGDRANVTAMVPAGTEPHDWEPAVADIRNLENADLFVYSGAGMEHWAEDVLESLDNQDLTVVEASDGVTLLEGDSHDDGHDHGEESSYDPHVWLDPQNAKKEMENIKNGFVQADPDHAADYEANFATWAEEFDKLDQEFTDTLGALENKNIVVAHEAYGYLCEAYGLHQMGIEGLTPDSEPDPARMAEIIDFVKENDVKVIFFEELASSKVADTVARETGAQVGVLSPLEGLSDREEADGADYFSVMRENLAALQSALE